MVLQIEDRRGLILVAFLLVIQGLLFWLSMQGDAFSRISVFCTGSALRSLSLLFGLLHLLFIVVSVVGVLSLRFPKVRPIYIALIGMGLLTLPIQAVLVSNEILRCDVP